MVLRGLKLVVGKRLPSIFPRVSSHEAVASTDPPDRYIRVAPVSRRGVPTVECHLFPRLRVIGLPRSPNDVGADGHLPSIGSILGRGSGLPRFRCFRGFRQADGGHRVALPYLPGCPGRRDCGTKVTRGVRDRDPQQANGLPRYLAGETSDRARVPRPASFQVPV